MGIGGLHRRLRHRLLVALLPHQSERRRAEDRPLVHPQPLERRHTTAPKSCATSSASPPASASPWSPKGSRRSTSSDQLDGDGLRVRPGLPLQPAGRRRHGLGDATPPRLSRRRPRGELRPQPATHRRAPDGGVSLRARQRARDPVSRQKEQHRRERNGHEGENERLEKRLRQAERREHPVQVLFARAGEDPERKEHAGDRGLELPAAPVVAQPAHHPDEQRNRPQVKEREARSQSGFAGSNMYSVPPTGWKRKSRPERKSTAQTSWIRNTPASCDDASSGLSIQIAPSSTQLAKSHSQRKFAGPLCCQ